MKRTFLQNLLKHVTLTLFSFLSLATACGGVATAPAGDSQVVLDASVATDAAVATDAQPDAPVPADALCATAPAAESMRDTHCAPGAGAFFAGGKATLGEYVFDDASVVVGQISQCTGFVSSRVRASLKVVDASTGSITFVLTWTLPNKTQQTLRATMTSNQFGEGVLVAAPECNEKAVLAGFRYRFSASSANRIQILVEPKTDETPITLTFKIGQ